MNGYVTTVYEPEDKRDSLAVRLFDRPIAFQRIFVDLTGSITAALMLSQAIYWTRRTSDPAGWFYKTQSDWQDETGMTRYEQETARKKLRQFEWWQEDLRKANGVPTMYYRVNVNRLYKDLAMLESVAGNDGSLQSGMRESSKPLGMRESSKPLNIEYTENTSMDELTSAITAQLQTHMPFGVTPQLVEQHRAIATQYGLDAWNAGFEATPQRAKHNANYVLKATLSNLPEVEPVKKATPATITIYGDDGRVLEVVET